MWPDQTYYTTKDCVTGRYKAHKLKGEEVAHVEQVGEGGRGGGAAHSQAMSWASCKGPQQLRHQIQETKLCKIEEQCTYEGFHVSSVHEAESP